MTKNSVGSPRDPMKFLLGGMFIVLLCAGCVVSQKRGTEWDPNAANKSNRVVTYVSPEEYDRMTPEERQRLNATVGVQGSMSWGGSGPAQRVSAGELDKALKNAAK